MKRFVRNTDIESGRRPSGASRRRAARCSASLLGAALLTSCGALVGDTPAVGGETHFLITCENGCGSGLSCIGGVCTRGCEPGFSSCSELAAQASCVSVPDESREGAGGFAGTCDVGCESDADCTPLGTGHTCRSGACRAAPETSQMALSSPISAPLVQAVEAETCLSGLRWTGGNSPSAEMLPGSDCVGCHRETGARPLVLAGTLYPHANARPEGPQPLDGCYGLEGVEVIITDSEGREYSTLTNRAGNFFLEGTESDIAMPYQASIRWNLDGAEIRTPMATQPSYGGCARCHGAAGPELPYDGLSFEDPEVVFPVGALFTPGLYPNER